MIFILLRILCIYKLEVSKIPKFYELLNQRNKLQKQIKVLKFFHKQKVKRLDKKINKLKEKIREIQKEDHYFKKFVEASEKAEDLRHRNWLLKNILRRFRPLVLSNETIKTLEKKAKEDHLKEFHFYNLKWGDDLLK